MMKAIILAAGKGTRLGRYTEHMPKGMLQFAGMSLIERQVKTYQECGINDIIIITGHKAEKIKIVGNVRTVFNKEYATTNMVESLFCAEDEFGDSIIVSYADIVFEAQVLKRLIAHKSDIVVTVDIDWKEYWIARYGTIWVDTESLVFGEDGCIVEIGKPKPKLREMDARYVGLIKFVGEGLEIAKKVYQEANRKYWRTENLKEAYMTDLLQAIIDYGAKVDALKIERGWLEFDSADDYEEAILWVKDGSIKRFLNVEEKQNEKRNKI